MEWNGVEGNGISPKPPGGACEWEELFWVGLKNSGKFPALSFEALVQVTRSYPKADLANRWTEIVEEVRSIPGTIQFPVQVLRTAVSRLEVRNLNSEKKEGAAPGCRRPGELISVPKEWSE
jgi:hypothetical protein